MSGYREHEPAPTLKPWVECFWTSEGAAGAEHLVVPDGCADLVFEDSAQGQQGHAVGTMSRAFLVHDPIPTTRLGVRFRAGGAATLLRAPLKAITDENAPLADVAREPGALLEAAFTGATPAARLAQLEALLLDLLRERPDPCVQAAVAALDRSAGAVRVAALAERLGCSRQHLARRFAAQVGLSPKTYARVARLQAALERVWAGETDWLAIALGAGYCDQAHFNGEFKALTGVTPGVYAAQRAVPFLQDPEPAAA